MMLSWNTPRIAALMLSLGASLSVLPAKAETTLERARTAGFVRVGFPNQVPYAFANEKGQLTGVDAEVARLVIAKMGIKEMDGVLTEFAALIPGLRAKRFDVVLAMFVNPARCAQVSFSEPIYKIGQGLIVRAGNPKAVAGYDDLIKRDLNIAIMAGAVQASYLKKLGAADSQVTSYPDGVSALAAVSSGRADVFAISSLSAQRMLETAGASSGLQMVPSFADPIVDGKPARGNDAFAFRKDDKDFLDAFNLALAEVMKTPAFMDTIKPFGFTKDNLPEETTDALCK